MEEKDEMLGNNTFQNNTHHSIIVIKWFNIIFSPFNFVDIREHIDYFIDNPPKTFIVTITICIC